MEADRGHGRAALVEVRAVQPLGQPPERFGARKLGDPADRREAQAEGETRLGMDPRDGTSASGPAKVRESGQRKRSTDWARRARGVRG